MLPVTRANLDHICCICLLDITPSRFTQKVYDVKMEKNISRILKLTALITILKNPINQKYINEYCRKMCETCYVKIQYSYTFREKIVGSTTMLKELLESNELNEQDIGRLQYFCRVCLNRQKSTKSSKCLTMMHLNWLKNCSGIRFTSLIDKETFRIKEGTNINEIAVINDTHFPKQMCINCFKKLQHVEEFRKSATLSFEYMISVMGDVNGTENYLMTLEDVQTKENVIWGKEQEAQSNQTHCTKQECIILETDISKYEIEEDISNTNIFEHATHNTCHILEPMVNPSRLGQQDNESFKDKMDLMDNLSEISDNSNEDLSLNLNESTDNTNNCLKKTSAKSSKQSDINGRNLKVKEDNVEDESEIKPKLQGNKKLSNYRKKSTANEERLKENKERDHVGNIECTDVNIAEETFFCEECSKTYSSKNTYKRHQRTVHIFDSSKMMMCPICSKNFKRKSHLTDHIKAVHEKLRPFKCSHCPQTFSAKNSKRVHELKHTENYPYVCDWCGKAFRQSSQLKIHLEIHTTKPELLCPICKRSQKSQNDLENHLKKHNDKRLQCPLCGKFFTRSYHLKDHHNAVHLKLRPFECTFCKIAFGDRKTRRIHEKSHTEYRPIKCSVCKSGFNTNYALTRHMHQFCHKKENDESNKRNSIS